MPAPIAMSARQRAHSNAALREPCEDCAADEPRSAEQQHSARCVDGTLLAVVRHRPPVSKEHATTAQSWHIVCSSVAVAGRVFIGISGWRYAPWRGVFYPRELRQRDELAYAAARFATLEINGSFYSLQRPEYYQRWAEQVPDDFVFAVKGSRYITHMLRLRGVERALANFFASGVLALREKLGPFLWQLPPTLRFARDDLERFLAMLPRTAADAARLGRRHDERVAGRAYLRAQRRQKLRHALEVRHPSFATPELVALLRAQDVALVVADTAGRWPLLEDLTSDFVYVRLHGDVELYSSGYGDAALELWAQRVRAWREGRQPPDARLAGPVQRGRSARDVYVYFDNDVKAYAPFDALKLAARVENKAAA
jgi:uncharacterized protein YecE (DUF72 family)